MSVLLIIGQCLCILKKSTTEAQQTYQEEYDRQMKERAEKINQIINALFVPISILMLFWCLYNLWKRKRKKQIALEKKREALTNLDHGKLFCMEKHPLNKKSISIKNIYKSGKLKRFIPVYCEKCLKKYPSIKKIHKCFQNCNFNICRDCFRKALVKMKTQIENKNYEQKLESKRNNFRKNGRKKLRIGNKKKKFNISKRMRQRLVKRIKQRFKYIFQQKKKDIESDGKIGNSIYKDKSTIRIKENQDDGSSNESWKTCELDESFEDLNETRKNIKMGSQDLTLSVESDNGTNGSSVKKSILDKENQNINILLKAPHTRKKRHTVNILRPSNSKSLTNLRKSNFDSFNFLRQDQFQKRKSKQKSIFKSKIIPFKNSRNRKKNAISKHSKKYENI